LEPFTGTATLTWSHGQYIDAMDYINGYFYIGNDDEQIARSTNLISWTIVDDQDASNFDYWNDIAGFVGTGGTESDRLVNGAQTLVLNANGSVTFPDGSIQTTAYTAADANIWVQTFETGVGAPTDIVAIAISVEYDSAGNVIALFSHYNDNDNSTYYSVGKYTTTGVKIWTARFADGVETDGWGLAVSGNYIYVAGQTLSSSESGYSVSTLTKLNSSDGTIVWSKTYDFGYSSNSQVVDVASDGDPVMVGYASNGTDDYVTTTKVDAADGSVQWSRALNGQADDEAHGMAVGPSGEVVAIGYMDQLGEGSDTDNHMLVVKYASDGTIAWQKAILFDAGFDCRGADADIDSDGNIYVTGGYQYVSEINGTSSALSILKLDSGGVKQWSRRVEGTCETFGVSVVVGADDKLYLSGVTAFAGYTGGETDLNNGFTWVAAKYGFDGTVEWQRLIDHTDSWSFAGVIWSGQGGGSNLAVKDGYVVLGGGFGNQVNSEDPRATVVQVSATGDTFATGPWAFTAASFSGLLDSSASDITVVDAEKTDTDNASNISVATVNPQFDSSAFLIGTLYTAGGSDRLVNGSNELVLGSTGTVTLPSGGTISEGYVTSNPTIQLTPASPSVASQKLVIKGGGSYDYTDNGININYYSNTGLVGETLTFSVYSDTYADQTLYWWIYPEGAGIGDVESGTVVLTGTGGEFTILIDSDDYEFTVRVSPEDNNYDPANVGVESGLINADAPTFDSPYHLHLTTGNLAETSIFLGTDNHNVRTTVDGGIQVTTESTADILPNTITITGADVAAVNLVYTRDLTETTPTWKSPQTGMPETDPYIRFLVGAWGIVAPDYDPVTPLYVNTGTLVAPLTQWSLNPPLGSVAPTGVYTYLTPDVHTWTFGTDGTTTFPTLTVPISDQTTPNGTGQTLKFSDSSQQAIIFGPVSTGSSPSAERIIIQGAPGYTGTTGEGGDIYLWAGPGGSTNGDGGDIKVRAGYGPGTGQGGYLNFQAGDSATGYGGHINIESGETGTYGQGSDITVQARSGGEIYLRTYTSNGTPKNWLFGNDGVLTLPKASKVSEVTPATGAAASIMVIQVASSIANISFVSVPPAPILDYTVPGTDIVVDVNWNANGFEYHSPRFTVVDGGTGHTGGGESGGGDVLTVPYADMGITTGGNWTWYVADIASDVVLTAGLESWTFGGNGTTTLPGAITRVVAGTVAKTGVILPTTTGIPTALSGSMTGLSLADGMYGPVTIGGVTFSVTVASGGISSFFDISSTTSYAVNATIGQLTSADLGDTPGQTTNINVDSVFQETPTALDLTKSINKLTDGVYSLADGVEGQIMYLVKQTGAISTEVGVQVPNYRVNGSQNTGGFLIPFRVYENSGEAYYDTVGFCTLIFTDGAWQQTGGAWD
jgi:hypothetical protein